MKKEQDRQAHHRFLQALQHEHLTCTNGARGGPMEITDLTPHHARQDVRSRLRTVSKSRSPERRDIATLGYGINYHDGRSPSAA